jgi:hypothetical protein
LGAGKLATEPPVSTTPEILTAPVALSIKIPVIAARSANIQLILSPRLVRPRLCGALRAFALLVNESILF